jgi:hypothetical protein
MILTILHDKESITKIDKAVRDSVELERHNDNAKGDIKRKHDESHKS